MRMSKPNLPLPFIISIDLRTGVLPDSFMNRNFLNFLGHERRIIPHPMALV